MSYSLRVLSLRTKLLLALAGLFPASWVIFESLAWEQRRLSAETGWHMIIEPGVIPKAAFFFGAIALFAFVISVSCDLRKARRQ